MGEGGADTKQLFSLNRLVFDELDVWLSLRIILILPGLVWGDLISLFISLTRLVGRMEFGTFS